MSGFSLSGLGSGIDWSAYITAIKNAEKTSLDNTLGLRGQTFQTKQKVYTNIQTFVDALRQNVQGFAVSGDFLTKSVTSSDSAVLTGTATLSAINQSATVQVKQLATNEVWQGQFTGVNNAVTSTDQTITINVRGQANVLNVTAGKTLKELAAQINEANIGVTATVFDTGAGGATPARIAITDSTIGKWDPVQASAVYNISITSTLTELSTVAFGATPSVPGQDSRVWLNNGTDDVYRDNNTLSDVIPGVTLNLLSAADGVWKTVTVNSSTDNALSRVRTFVEKYNSVVKEIRKMIKVDPNNASQQSVLSGDGTLRNILTQIQSTALNSVLSLPAGAAINSLADIGITTKFNRSNASDPDNGTLEINEDKFNAALSSNFDDVVKFFEGATVGTTRYSGFAAKMDTLLDSILDTTNGSLSVAIKETATEVLRITDDYEKKLARIDRKQEMLKAKFARLETLLSQLNSQGSALSQALSSINQSSSKK